MNRQDPNDEFRDFAEQAWESLLRTATLLAGNRSAGEDLMQEALLRTYQAWRRVDAQRATGYARKVMTNLAIDGWRRRRHEPVPLPDDSFSALPVSQLGQQGVDDRDDILRRLSALNPRERAMLVLRYYGDLSEGEVADQLGVSVGTVKSTCSRALGKLRANRAVLEG